MLGTFNARTRYPSWRSRTTLTRSNNTLPRTTLPTRSTPTRTSLAQVRVVAGGRILSVGIASRLSERPGPKSCRLYLYVVVLSCLSWISYCTFLPRVFLFSCRFMILHRLCLGFRVSRCLLCSHAIHVFTASAFSGFSVQSSLYHFHNKVYILLVTSIECMMYSM